jgi:cobalt-zinc-cadmium resistance protein CzcA
MKTILISLIFLLTFFSISAQEKLWSLDELIELAKENNQGLKAKNLHIEMQEKLIKSAFQFSPTDIYNAFDQNDLALNGLPNYKVGIQQSFDFPTIYGARKQVLSYYAEQAKNEYAFTFNQLNEAITSVYYSLQLQEQKKEILEILKSTYDGLSELAQQRFELGESNNLESTLARAKQRKIDAELNSLQRLILSNYQLLMGLIQSPDSIRIQSLNEPKFVSTLADVNKNPGYVIKTVQKTIAKEELDLQKQQLLPSIKVEYFLGTNRGINNYLHGYQVGLAIPLLFSGENAKIKAHKLDVLRADAELKDYENRLSSHQKQLVERLNALAIQLEFYEQEGLALSNEILQTAKVSFENGEIDFFRYAQSIENAQLIRMEHLTILEEYNKTSIAISYLNL